MATRRSPGILFFLLVFFAPASALFSSAPAQVLMSSNHPGELSSAQKNNCAHADRILRHTLSLYPAPQTWTFYVVCDTESWDELVNAQQANGGISMGSVVYAETIQSRSITLLDAQKLIAANEQFSAEEIVAHELAHIFLHSSDENAVQKLTAQWVHRAESIAQLSPLP